MPFSFLSGLPKSINNWPKLKTSLEKTGKANKGLLKGRYVGNKNVMSRPEVREKHKKSMQEVIHHINGNHFDKRPENEMVMTQSKHIKLHMKQGDL